MLDKGGVPEESEELSELRDGMVFRLNPLKASEDKGDEEESSMWSGESPLDWLLSDE